MKIKEIISQSRRDFTATMECEHCGKTELNEYGYDDDNYHRNVIPKMECKTCGKTAADTYRPIATKYTAYEVV